MTCPNHEQLTAVSLGLPDDGGAAAHVDHCAACARTVSELQQVNSQLATMHAAANQSHTDARSQLLTALADSPTPATRTGAIRSWFGRLSMGQRIAAGGFGLSTAAVLLLLFVAFANSAGRLSAMERMVKQLREVTSLSYEWEGFNIREHGERPRKVRQYSQVYWRAPASLWASMKIERWPEPHPSSNANSELRTDIVESYTPGRPGIMIDYKTKTFFRTPELQPDDDLGKGSPVNWLRRIQQGSVQVIRDLGTQLRDGKMAHGYFVSLNNPDPHSGENAVEVWVDPATDFPLECNYTEEGDTSTAEAWSEEVKVTNCRWNIEINSKQFDTEPPAGFEDVTPSTDEQTIAQIIAALQLYAELSGGHYPGDMPFNVDAVRDEMLKFAGFTGPPQPVWTADEKYQRIQQSMAGLREITRVLHNHITRAGYQGAIIGPQDKDKVLLWWIAGRPHDFRVFYGDLRTEIVPLKVWQKIAPADIAEVFADED